MFVSIKKSLLTLAVSAFAAVPAFTQTVTVDSKIPAYTVAPGVSGNLNSIGSDTLANLMTYWAEGFRQLYPNVNIQIEAKGSTTAPPALIAGTSQIGPMSRPMKAEEIDAFEKKFGYKPTEVKVAIDALAVFVNKDNPVNSLNLVQIDSIFSSTYKRGGLPITKWADLGVKGAVASKSISLFGRNSASGTYGYFKEHALAKGDYTTRVKEQPGSSAVVQGIASDIGAIGYSGIGYATSGVKALAIANDAKSKAIPATYENCLNGSYPIARYLYVYINAHPKRGVDKLTAEFIKYIHSKAGQEVVVKDGFFPLTPQIIDQSKSEIGL